MKIIRNWYSEEYIHFYGSFVYQNKRGFNKIKNIFAKDKKKTKKTPQKNKKPQPVEQKPVQTEIKPLPTKKPQKVDSLTVKQNIAPKKQINRVKSPEITNILQNFEERNVSLHGLHPFEAFGIVFGSGNDDIKICFTDFLEKKSDFVFENYTQMQFAPNAEENELILHFIGPAGNYTMNILDEPSMLLSLSNCMKARKATKERIERKIKRSPKLIAPKMKDKEFQQTFSGISPEEMDKYAEVNAFKNAEFPITKEEWESMKPYAQPGDLANLYLTFTNEWGGKTGISKIGWGIIDFFEEQQWRGLVNIPILGRILMRQKVKKPKAGFVKGILAVVGNVLGRGKTIQESFATELEAELRRHNNDVNKLTWWQKYALKVRGKVEQKLVYTKTNADNPAEGYDSYSHVKPSWQIKDYTPVNSSFGKFQMKILTTKEGFWSQMTKKAESFQRALQIAENVKDSFPNTDFADRHTQIKTFMTEFETQFKEKKDFLALSPKQFDEWYERLRGILDEETAGADKWNALLSMGYAQAERNALQTVLRGGLYLSPDAQNTPDAVLATVLAHNDGRSKVLKKMEHNRALFTAEKLGLTPLTDKKFLNMPISQRITTLYSQIFTYAEQNFDDLPENVQTNMKNQGITKETVQKALLESKDNPKGFMMKLASPNSIQARVMQVLVVSLGAFLNRIPSKKHKKTVISIPHTVYVDGSAMTEYKKKKYDGYLGISGYVSNALEGSGIKKLMEYEKKGKKSDENADLTIYTNRKEQIQKDYTDKLHALDEQGAFNAESIEMRIKSLKTTQLQMLDTEKFGDFNLDFCLRMLDYPLFAKTEQNRHLYNKIWNTTTAADILVLCKKNRLDYAKVNEELPESGEDLGIKDIKGYLRRYFYRKIENAKAEKGLTLLENKFATSFSCRCQPNTPEYSQKLIQYINNPRNKNKILQMEKGGCVAAFANLSQGEFIKVCRKLSAWELQQNPKTIVHFKNNNLDFNEETGHIQYKNTDLKQKDFATLQMGANTVKNTFEGLFKTHNSGRIAVLQTTFYTSRNKIPGYSKKAGEIDEKAPNQYMIYKEMGHSHEEIMGKIIPATHGLIVMAANVEKQKIDRPKTVKEALFARILPYAAQNAPIQTQLAYLQAANVQIKRKDETTQPLSFQSESDFYIQLEAGEELQVNNIVLGDSSGGTAQIQTFAQLVFEKKQNVISQVISFEKVS